MAASAFQALAPRLARAHRQRRCELALEKRARSIARERILKAQWLVAHRDLQLARAYHRGSGTYIDIRRRKLTEAHAELERVTQAAAQIGVT